MMGTVAWQEISLLRAALAGILFAAGLLFSGSGVLALFRFRQFHTRLLAGSTTDSAGLTMIVSGCMLLSGWRPATAKMGVVLMICLLIHPLVTMELARCRQSLED